MGKKKSAATLVHVELTPRKRGRSGNSPESRYISSIFLLRQGDGITAEVFRGGYSNTWRNITRSSYQRLMSYYPQIIGDEMIIQRDPKMTRAHVALRNMSNGILKRKRLSSTTLKVLTFIVLYKKKHNGNSPSGSVIANHLKLATSTIAYHISVLCEEGVLIKGDDHERAAYRVAGIQISFTPELQILLEKAT